MLKIDQNTLRKRRETRDDEFLTERAKFARICVEIDLSKVLVSFFELNNRAYKVEYEGLHFICFNCGRYGHSKDSCPLLKDQVVHPLETEPTVEEVAQSRGPPAPKTGTIDQQGEVFGAWMISQKKSRCNPLKIGVTGQVNQENNGEQVNVRGSQFAVLVNEETEDNLPQILPKETTIPTVPIAQLMGSKNSMKGTIGKANIAQNKLQIVSSIKNVSPKLALPRVESAFLGGTTIAKSDLRKAKLVARAGQGSSSLGPELLAHQNKCGSLPEAVLGTGPPGDQLGHQQRSLMAVDVALDKPL
ncbi:Zinc finger, CCHC-type [Sesbania bispinosa]|nr:Zinc finger, CCHC-type [Sesbania bispinosa]